MVSSRNATLHASQLRTHSAGITTSVTYNMTLQSDKTSQLVKAQHKTRRIKQILHMVMFHDVNSLVTGRTFGERGVGWGNAVKTESTTSINPTVFEKHHANVCRRNCPVSQFQIVFDLV